MIQNAKSLSIKMCTWREKKQKILRKMLDLLYKLKRLNLTIEEYIHDDPFPTLPYSRPSSKLFFSKIRSGDFWEAKILLEKDKFLIYDIDNVSNLPTNLQGGQTALLWACKRNDIKMLDLLLEYNPDILSFGINGHSSAYYALKSNNHELMIVIQTFLTEQKLFEHGASIRDLREDIEATKDTLTSEILMVIKRYKQLELKLLFASPNEKLAIHKTEGTKVGNACRIAISKYQKNQENLLKEEQKFKQP